jgi:hypothetical protein
MGADRLVGAVLHVPAGLVRYRATGLVLRVDRVRVDISQWYGGAWVWLEGVELDHLGLPVARTPALVHVDACTLTAQ